jgi:hypothetical protein
MSFRLTGILALLVAFLGLVIHFWDRDDDTARARMERARRAFRFDPARVDRLLIETGDLSVECHLRGRQWHLTSPVAARADPVAIERLLGALTELPRGDIILPPRRAVDAYAPYGLDAPRARISIIEGTVTNRILIGRRTPLGDGVYVRQSDHAGLARVHISLLDLLPASADALRDRSLLSGAPAAIDRLDLRGPSGYIQLARDAGGTWRLFQPFTARADPGTVSALVETLLACSVVHFVQDAVGDLAPYGLDSRSAITAVLNNGAGDGSQMLSFGDPLPNDPSLVYARLQAENSIYAVPLAVRQALVVRPDDLRNRRIPGIDPDAIQRVRVEEAEASLEFFRGEDDQWQLAAPVRAPADPEAVRALLRSWADVRMVAFESAPPSAPPPPFSRTIRIDLRNAKDPPVVLSLGPHPAAPGTVRMAIEGDSTTAIASPAGPLEFPLDPLPYRSREVLFLPADDISGVRIVSGAQTERIERDPATGQWPPAAPWIDRLLSALAPLRAETLLGEEGGIAGFDKPHLTIEVLLRGRSGLATTVIVGSELSPGGARRATVRGRDLVFTLPAATVETLTPPPPKEPE